MDDDNQSARQHFTQLYDAYYASVRSYVWRREPDNADDIAAETFTIAWQRLEDVPPVPLPWLIGVARIGRRNACRQAGTRTGLARSLVSPSA